MSGQIRERGQSTASGLQVERDAALAALDKLLAERPEREGHDFSEAVRRLCVLRESVILAWRRSGESADRRRLEQVNAVISIVVGGHYPLGPVPWDHIESARRELARVLGLTDVS